MGHAFFVRGGAVSLAQIVTETQQKRHKGVTSNRFFCGRKKGYKMKKGLLISVLILLCIGSGCASDGDFVPMEYSAEAGKVNAIILDVRDRRIDISPSSDGKIHIDYFTKFPLRKLELMTNFNQILSLLISFEPNSFMCPNK